MIFTTQIPSLSDAWPRAVRALESARDVETYHARLRLRHPLAIYNISLSQVVGRFSSALTELEKLRHITGFGGERDAKEEAFLAALDSLLDALVEHFDDCNNVLRCFFQNEADPRYKKSYSQFKAATRSYRDHVAKIVNRIKHSQGRLRSVLFSWPGGDSVGYFVEGVNTEGVVGPDEDIHPGGSTAFSVARDFRLHLCGIYFVSTHLAQAIYEASGVRPDGKHVSAQGVDALATVIRGVSCVPPVFFPDEMKKAIPSVKMASDGGVTISCGKDNRERATSFPSAHVKVRFMGDGITRQFRIPYLGQSARKW